MIRHAISSSLGCVLAACCALAFGALGGCASHRGLELLPPSEGNPGLNLALKVNASAVWVNAMPGLPDDPQPRCLRMKLSITNQAGATYSGPANGDLQITRFWLVDNGNDTVWQSEDCEPIVIRHVHIQPGQTITYFANCTIDDARFVRGHTLTAYAEFMPQHLRVNVDIPVRDAT